LMCWLLPRKRTRKSTNEVTAADEEMASGLDWSTNRTKVIMSSTRNSGRAPNSISGGASGRLHRQRPGELTRTTAHARHGQTAQQGTQARTPCFLGQRGDTATWQRRRRS
jgi:hypothetical protein